MEYVMAEVNFTGSDDIYFQAFKIQSVEQRTAMQSSSLMAG